jgi:neutral ceramidase
MTFHDMVQDVLKLLEQKYPGVYTYQNLMMSSTHTHSTSGGYSRRVLYEIASLGFYKDNLEAVVNGVVAAIVEAHESVQDGQMFVATVLHALRLGNSTTDCAVLSVLCMLCEVLT